MTEDITYCSNSKCGYLRCERNPKHIKLPIPHSFAELEGTDLCYKAQNMLKTEKLYMEVQMIEIISDHKPTNADRIRGMRDEELADFIIKGCWGENNSKINRNEVLAWLQEPDSMPE